MHVLHVDDESDIREVAALALEMDPDVNVRSAASGGEALGVLESNTQIDVILLDVMMPELDGPGTLERLRTIPARADTPVIFMTARAQSHELERFLGLGALAVILKPFDPMTLGQQIRDHLASA
ncbi:response regulator [Brevundimonas sp. NIBR10]|uniref:response regulator n=1 Tax=Brevundimonas sp. NIBR10 TaxID=3015997 RepID=UPI0022F14976|nr:response regulator [Brevundimonas sp. NIBR10]